MVKVKHSANRRKSSREHDADRGARMATPKASGSARILRIIGGKHRGRRLQFPAGVSIRPTPDRVRETLFNWLQPRIDQSRVLDLFAGSGALGLEALSRGAAQVTFVEKDRRAAAAIEDIASEWQETNARVVCVSATTWLAAPSGEQPYDIVFLDPPYDSDLLATAANALGSRLAPDARVYLERRARDSLPALPASWKELRAGRAGEVGYHLFSV